MSYPSASQFWSSWPVDEVDALLGLEATEMDLVPPLQDTFEWPMPDNGELPAADATNPCLGPSTVSTLSHDSASATPPSEPKLPDLPDILQLVDLFFEKCYRFFPIIHKQTILDAIKSEGAEGIPSGLLYAIIAVAAGVHPNCQIRQAQQSWYEQAKSLVSREMQQPHHVLQTLQSAVLVIYLGLALVDYSSSIVILGEAWRKTVAVGHSYGDGLQNLIVQTLGTQEKAKWIEKEEITRISWMLFIMDRGMCYPIGLMHAIDDRRMKMEFPMSEDDFQGTKAPSSCPLNRFTYNLDTLITTMRDRSLQGSATQMQYIILGYALLGRISEALDHTDDGDEARKERLDALCAQLAKVRLMLPRSATELSMAKYDEFMEVVWLNILLNACTVLLHHRPLREGESLDDDETDTAKNWPHCVAAARNTISVLRDASRVSIDFVSNAHFPCLLFTCSRILLVEYFYPSKCGKGARDSKLREDLEVVALTYIRLKEEWRGLGQKFGKGMYFYLHQGEGFARETKAGGARSLLGVCDTWITIPDDFDLTIPK
ncbi:fungal-specific transcription factor domain-containing protein [Trichoderma gracile]